MCKTQSNYTPISTQIHSLKQKNALLVNDCIVMYVCI